MACVGGIDCEAASPPAVLQKESKKNRGPGGTRRGRNCTKTDTSGLVEYTKANERTPSKELGQMAPYLRYEECHSSGWLSKERAATVY